MDPENPIRLGDAVIFKDSYRSDDVLGVGIIIGLRDLKLVRYNIVIYYVNSPNKVYRRYVIEQSEILEKIA